MMVAAEGDEGLVDAVADLPADAQAPEPVQRCDGALCDPAVDSEAGAVFGAASGDDRSDLEPAHLVAVDVVVIATVGVDPAGPTQEPAAPAADRQDGLDQRDHLHDLQQLRLLPSAIPLQLAIVGQG
ncbi:hypothetical protein GCM10022403_037180 [Streptomyces coacervatus]|uniref:Uncharacterized protein n=1 Tax=Streptomyces coacervatus TaxID=647381 RepID=A0ABP7HMM3_9ACTN|nr:hypothetical protein [Streptomyces coacervatus]MDF2270862.1 hypothetical protein [Streptomyces coacervatus]